MKKWIPIFGLLLLSGCDLEQLMPLQDSVSEHHYTVTTPGQTNIINGVEVVTPASESTYTVPVTNKVVAPSWTHTIDAARGLNQLNPTPTAPLINLGLGALAFILGAAAKIYNGKANKKQAVLEAVIDGVEKANDPKVKEQIKLAATNAGVQPDLHKIVVERTP